jgi:hypothetical protein
MILPGNQIVKPVTDLNAELRKMKGEIDENTAKITLAKFLRYNLGFSSQLMLGIDLVPIQEMHMNAMFRKNNIMFVWSRGSGKSTVAGWYAIFKCIFEPGTRVVIASANFRTSRRIFEEIEKLLATEGAALARQCFDKKPYKRNDAFSWGVNGGHITAIPLSEDTRGMRCDVLILDEVLLLAPSMINEVLAPFLSSPRDAAWRIRVQKLEEGLIKTGALHPNNKTIFENAAQMIALSSASYQFQHLYKMYEDWSSFVEKPELIEMKETDEERPTYFLSQLSWEAVPGSILNRSFIESQRASSSEDSFSREFEAQFKDGGDGYFSMKKMNACTIEDGMYPHSKVIGEKDKKYVVSVDANASKALNADYFAMAVIEIDEQTGEGIYVHGYQNVGGDLQDHVKYLYYLMSHFNVQLLCCDSANLDSFIDACNDNILFKSNLNKKITYITEWDFNKEGQDYLTMLDSAKKQYNVDMGCMCIRQNFSSEWLMRSNTHLQSCIDHKKIWFASRSSCNPNYISGMFQLKLPLDLIFPRGLKVEFDNKEEKRKGSIREFIEIQDDIIVDTKAQCANIEVKTTARGTQSFDLPKGQSNSTANNKPRKDNYTALLLANWGVKCYFDLQTTPEAVKKYTMSPILI